MEEIEVKILEVASEAVIGRLVAAGGRQVQDTPMHALYFDTPAGDLRRRGDSLRLRREGDRVVLNHKAHRPAALLKIKEELETDVGSLETARAILESLGYTVWFEMAKQRRGFVLPSLPGAHFLFDRFQGAHAHVPELLEIETTDRATLPLAVEAAGFTMAQALPWNAFQVVEHYRDRR